MPRFRASRVHALVIIGLIALDFGLMLTGRGSLFTTLLTIGLPFYGLFLIARKIMRRSRLIWRLRTRLIVTWVFVGVVPILLIAGLVACGAYIVVGQIATYLVSSELKRKISGLESAARTLVSAPTGQRAEIARGYPQAEIFITEDRTFPAPPEGWKDFAGVVQKNKAYYAMALATRGDTQAALLAPLTSDELEKLVPGVGSVNIGESKTFSGHVPPAWSAFDFECIWGNILEIPAWERPDHPVLRTLGVITRPSAVLRLTFVDLVAQASLIVFVSIAGIFVLMEIISVVASVSMTRSVTGAVHHLYEGTQTIGAGDFTHRIPVHGNDQLASLGNSFNQMTEQLGHLLVVAKEKERLQSELDIASEVQNQLFPRVPPPMATIRLLGACEPARSVSGDYYDYLCLPNGSLAIAIGDVAGKGISAALLMASIQSIMRTQLAGGVPSPARMVSQLNRQLYENTSPEKYATFFFGIYEAHSRTLTYTNAGHLPPLLVCGEEITPLEVTGTVVGLFPKVEYEERTVILHPGDLLISYTDGVTEPENAYGEEFGDERLADVVLKNRTCSPEEIVSKVMEAVKDWSHSPELPDDMTVLIAQGIA